MYTAEPVSFSNKSTNVRKIDVSQDEFSFFYTDSAMLRDGQEVTLRPLQPDDEAAHRAFAAQLSSMDLRQRFFRTIRGLTKAQWRRLIDIDYRREMAFIATAAPTGGRVETLGVARMVMDSDSLSAEIALIVRSDFKRLGLGQVLLEHLLHYCRERGVQRIYGTVLPDNTAMLGLARKLGMRQRFVPGERVVAVSLDLAP